MSTEMSTEVRTSMSTMCDRDDEGHSWESLPSPALLEFSALEFSTLPSPALSVGAGERATG